MIPSSHPWLAPLNGVPKGSGRKVSSELLSFFRLAPLRMRRDLRS